MSRRILVIDDDPVRHAGFDLHFPAPVYEVVHAHTYSEGLDALRNKGPWDLACLDHDLGDLNNDADFIVGGYGQPYFLTGLDLAIWLRDNLASCPRNILIHSWNPDGAKNMESVLRNIEGITVRVQPYSAPK